MAFQGPLAVCVFFILSGDALASPYIRVNDPSLIARTAARRYTRLTVPILMCCLLVYGLMTAGMTANIRAAPLLKSDLWLGQVLNFEPSLYKTIKYSLHGVYFSHTSVSSYNPLLWTMQIEMLGSIITFVALFVCHYLSRPGRFIGVLAAYFLFVGSYFGLFFVGILLSMARQSGLIDRLRLAPAFVIASWLILVSIYIACAFEIGMRSSEERQRTLLAILLVACIYINPIIVSALKSPISRYLGKISFALYLTQFPIIITFLASSAIFLSRNSRLSLCMATAIGLVCIVLTIILSDIFTRLETMFQRIINRRLDRLFGLCASASLQSR
jgi:peptidoglycan/LPS O-acetylase OafA/YrhL